MSPAVTYPLYTDRSGWDALLPRRAVHSGNAVVAEQCDYAVIGAGYTGLAAARRLAELNPEAYVVVFEASRVGEGSSARNSGFLISLPHNTSMSGHFTAGEVARKQIHLYELGLAWLKEIVNRHAIPCGWNVAGKYHAAATQEGEHKLRHELKTLESWGVAAREVPVDELHARIGTAYYRYGIHTSHNVFVQPAALIRGLADSLPTNVTVLEDTPVLDIGKGPIYQVKTPMRTFRAKNVVLANNGFARHLGFLKDRLITIYTYAGMTPELAESEQALHGSDDEWGVIPANRLGTTLRKIRGGRFMVRSAYSYEHAQPPHVVRAMLTDCYRRRYPDLKSHELEFVWGGVTALTRNGATYFGKLDTGLYASVGCNGAGVLKGTVYGKYLAELVMDGHSQGLADIMALKEPTWLPPEPIRRIAVATAISVQKRHAGLER